uniref:Uncharacterized protein n=1 Tax=Oryza officinalis TaxID=4535 RepID=A0A1V1H6L7_9ORYZ|nr:hypothetical protein [Oryza officinalis]
MSGVGFSKIDGNSQQQQEEKEAGDLDQDLGMMKEELEREVLNSSTLGSGLWGKEMDSILNEESEWQGILPRWACPPDDYYQSESEFPVDPDECDSFDGYWYEFRYEDGNPYYAAEREERWENQVMEQMKFIISTAKQRKNDFFCPIFEGSLHVEGPCHLDQDIMSTEHLFPRLPKWKNRWVNGYDHRNEPCRRAIQVFDLNVSSPHDEPMEIYERDRYRWHIDTGHCGTVALEMVALDKAVLGTLELEWGELMIFDGKVSVGNLPPVTLCVNCHGVLLLCFYTYNSPSNDKSFSHGGGVNDHFEPVTEDVLIGNTSFIPQKEGSSTASGSCSCCMDGLEISALAKWSPLFEQSE